MPLCSFSEFNFCGQPLCSHYTKGYVEGDGTPLQYSCLENPMDREAWWATVHRVTMSQT